MDDRINDGGPAFPQHLFAPVPGGGGYWTQEGGMTLRDWFAGQALPSLTADRAWRDVAKITGTNVSAVLAQVAYEYADAMLAAREAK